MEPCHMAPVAAPAAFAPSRPRTTPGSWRVHAPGAAGPSWAAWARAEVSALPGWHLDLLQEVPTI